MQSVAQLVIGELRNDWKSQRIYFPENFQVILCHQVLLTNHLFSTTHAGQLFPAKDGCVYLEKAGGRGPFVRIDFEAKDDLLTWLAGKFDKKSGDYIFATFNDRKIDLLPVEK